ncbi:MAG: glycosyltransferase family 39 protein [Candidatus Aenigmarchaeota archaeon]|nr:glycosyltransferase family 39 protein [Candidatus Aenigmarchaeota archaeon]
MKRTYAYAAIVLVSLFWLLFLGTNRGYWWDELVYLELGKNVRSGLYEMNSGQESFRPPVFPLTVAAFLPFGELFLKVVVIAFAIAACMLLYMCIERLDKRAALISLLFLGTSPLFFFFGHRFLAETAGAFLALLSAAVFFYSMHNEKYLVALGPVLGLSILAKYQNILLIPAFAAFLVWKRRYGLLRSNYALASAIGFAAVMVPFIAFEVHAYGSLPNFIHAQLFDDMQGLYGLSSQTHFYGAWHYYASNAVQLFGLSALFMVPFLLKKRKSDFEMLLLITTALALLFFSFIIFRKEARYLISFSPFFAACFAYGLLELRQAGKWMMTVALLFVAANAAQSYFLVQDGADDGENVRNAALFVRGINETVVVADYYPAINYLADKKAVRFPENESDLAAYDTYAVAAKEVPFTPAYAFNNSNVVARFGSGWDEVIIYRTP